MSIKTDYKIRKSKLIFCVPIPKNFSSYEDLQAKEKKVCQMTYSSVRHSNHKFQTINYKKYDHQRRLQLQKRKQNGQHLNLFLDGANPPFNTYDSQNVRKNQKKQKGYYNQLFNTNSHLQYNNSKKASTERTLKNILFKQIQSKDASQKQQKPRSNNTLAFDSLEELFVLKKINKITRQKREQLKKSKQFEFMDLKQQGFQKQKIIYNKSSKYSIFSERSFENNRSKNVLNSPQKQSFFPSVQAKASFRPLIFLQNTQTKKIYAQSYIVVKHPEMKIISGITFKKNAEIASLTKIMTFYTMMCICRQYSIDYKQKIIQIGQVAQQMSGTSAQIFSGQKFTLEQLFYGLLLPSGNDAAVAIANEGGQVLKKNKNSKISIEQQNVKCFIKYMNVTAKSIGMKTSIFSNPHGLSNPQNLSNPYQLSILISQCFKFQQFLQITGTKVYSFWTSQGKHKRQVRWQNTHKLLRRPGFIGGKTGVTVTAGPCLATVYKSKQGDVFIVIVLRAPKLSRRFKQTRWILGLSLKKLDSKKYETDSNIILKSNAQLDSDNSSDQQAFDFSKGDSPEMKKRNKILIYQM